MHNKRFIVILFLLIISVPGIHTAMAQDKFSPYKVGQQTIVFQDTIRNRKLITELWYPTQDKSTAEEQSDIAFIRIPTSRKASIAKGRYPLILFSHGTGGGRLTVEWLCAGLATNGYIVVAVDHFGNTFDNPIPEEFVKFWQRPLDLHFVLNQVLNNDSFFPAIDPTRIGAAGFSLGGFSIIALAGATMDLPAITAYLKSETGKAEAAIPEMPGIVSFFDKPDIQESFNKTPSLADYRIKSVFVMVPAIGQAFPEKSNFSKVSAAVYIVAAGSDKIAPIQTNAGHYARLIAQAKFTTINEQAGHYVFLNEAKAVLIEQAPVYFSDPPSVSRKAIHEKTL